MWLLCLFGISIVIARYPGYKQFNIQFFPILVFVLDLTDYCAYGYSLKKEK